MKRIGALISLLLLIVMLSASFCFAGIGLELKESYPENGAKNVSVENSGVKLYFNESTSKEYAKTNLKYIKLTDSKGKKQPIQVLYHPKEKGLVLVLLDNKVLEAKSDYTLTVAPGFKAANGDPLKKPIEITFKTIDTSMNMTINMVMMVAMFGGIMFYSSRSMKKQMAEEQKQKDDKVNPYKVARETGKSVQEVIEKDQKEKEKKAREEAKKNGKHRLEKDTDDEKDPKKVNHYKVKGSKPITQGGGTYVTGRKAKAEAEAKARAAKGTTKPKTKKGGSKHK